MLTKLTPEIIRAIKDIESILVSKKYNELFSEKRTNRLSSEDVEKAIKDYGGKVTVRPPNSLSNIQAIKIEGSDIDTYRVDYDLYVDYKQSDLTLSVIVVKTKDKYVASIEDLHVL